MNALRFVIEYLSILFYVIAATFLAFTIVSPSAEGIAVTIFSFAVPTIALIIERRADNMLVKADGMSREEYRAACLWYVAHGGKDMFGFGSKLSAPAKRPLFHKKESGQILAYVAIALAFLLVAALLLGVVFHAPWAQDVIHALEGFRAWFEWTFFRPR